MRNVMKRLMVAVLALMLLTGAVLPAALAADNRAVANASRGSIYAGMMDTIILTNKYGEQLDNGNFRWTTSNSKAVSVNSRGEVWGKKPGASATITATNKSNRSNKVKIKIKVLRNKVDNLSPRPSATLAEYGKWGLLTKSIEIVAPGKVVVEYYVVINYPSNWRANRINWLSDKIDVYDQNTKEYISWLVNGRTKSISGFRRKWGKSVQVVKATYTGAKVGSTNIRAQLHAYTADPQGNLSYTARR